MKISFQIVALALLASSHALSTSVTERDEGVLVVERNPDPKKGGLLKGALGLIAGAAAAGGAAKAGGGAATPASGPASAGSSLAASSAPQSSAAAARRRLRKARAAALAAKAQATE
ncbi:hypothetical protein BKA65DRAFT_600350 [Rhexocercosporidium sp. MPI-PUGE-AT-0058]|nr:hypothetical protein BKA65DRAFT_600350 [Rhexocercosporidium sp. MPI-PUGE-AT-0058]